MSFLNRRHRRFKNIIMMTCRPKTALLYSRKNISLTACTSTTHKSYAELEYIIRASIASLGLWCLTQSMPSHQLCQSYRSCLLEPQWLKAIPCRSAGRKQCPGYVFINVTSARIYHADSRVVYHRVTKGIGRCWLS